VASTSVISIYIADEVVFPGCSETLLLTDSSSIDMARKCITQTGMFGCIPRKPGTGETSLLYRVGTLVEVIALKESKVKPVEIILLGKERFRVIERITSGEPITARVIPVDDVDITSSTFLDEISLLRQEILENYEKLSLKYPGKFTPINEEMLKNASNKEFSFLIAGHVHLRREDRITLLETTSTRDRMRKLLECLTAIPPIQTRLIPGPER
jgi:ATP-dependent Lon protease